MSGDNGRAAVVGEAVTGAVQRIAGERAAAAGEQLPMFEAPTRFHGPRADAVRAAIERRSGPGRPNGSQNKTTVEMRRYLLARGVDPLVSLMRYAMMPPDLLAQELKCTILEAFREWRALQEALAPYLYGKAVPLDGDGKPVPFMMLQFGQFGAAPAQGGVPPWRYLEALENQALLAPADPVSHGEPSHGEAK